MERGKVRYSTRSSICPQHTFRLHFNNVPSSGGLRSPNLCDSSQILVPSSFGSTLVIQPHKILPRDISERAGMYSKHKRVALIGGHVEESVLQNGRVTPQASADIRDSLTRVVILYKLSPSSPWRCLNSAKRVIGHIDTAR